MALIQTRHRNCPRLETDLILAINTVTPRTDKLISSKQAHVCHRKGVRKHLSLSLAFIIILKLPEPLLASRSELCSVTLLLLLQTPPTPDYVIPSGKSG